MWGLFQLRLIICTKEVHGGLVLYAGNPGFAPVWFEKIRRALALIERTSPRIARRISRDVDSILVSQIVGPDYVRGVRAIRLRGPAMLQREVRDVALTIIHEATHARIANRGISYAQGQQARHEHACVRAEARFARKLPGGDALVDDIMSKLERRWWTDDARRSRRLAEFDRLNLKGPIPRFIRRRIERRSMTSRAT